MSDVLVRVKRAILAGNYQFSRKARLEMEVDGLTELDVAESILWSLDIFEGLSWPSMDCAGRAQRRRRFGSARQQRLWMRFPALPPDPKRRRASLCASLMRQTVQSPAFLMQSQSTRRSVPTAWSVAEFASISMSSKAPRVPSKSRALPCGRATEQVRGSRQ